MTPQQRALTKRIRETSWDTIVFFGSSIYDNVRWRVVETYDGLFHWAWTEQTFNRSTVPDDGCASIKHASSTYCGAGDFTQGDYLIALPNCIWCMRRPYPG